MARQLSNTDTGRSIVSNTLLHVLRLATCVLIVKVTFGVIEGYDDYFPPSFSSDFLRGREAYFFGSYQWTFYAHIIPGPLTLILGMILLSERFRRKYFRWHRALGKIQVACVLLLVTPSGLWMAFYAQTGVVAGVGFAALAIATGVCVWFGWRCAVRRRFAAHRRWMLRCYVLLCSAVVLRLTAGVFTVAGVEAAWTYPFAAWTSWLIPLAVLELFPSLPKARGPRSRSLELGDRLPSVD